MVFSCFSLQGTRVREQGSERQHPSPVPNGEGPGAPIFFRRTHLLWTWPLPIQTAVRRRMPSMSAFKKVFTHTDPGLAPVLEELKRREPIFHAREFGRSRSEFEKATAPDYWEASASGRRYSREFILSELEKHPPVDSASAGWQCQDHALRQLGPDVFLITYTLRQL